MNPKRVLFEQWMEGDHVMVHLDSRLSGVVVPGHLLGNPALALKLSYKFQGSTTVGDDGIKTYLKFSGHYFECILPWNAVWGMSSESSEERLWIDSLPREILEDFAVKHLQSIGISVPDGSTTLTSSDLSLTSQGSDEDKSSERGTERGQEENGADKNTGIINTARPALALSPVKSDEGNGERPTLVQSPDGEPSAKKSPRISTLRRIK